MTTALQDAGYKATSVVGFFWPVDAYDVLQHWWTEVWIDSRLVVVDLTLDQIDFGRIHYCPIYIGDKTPDYLTPESAKQRLVELQRRWELHNGRPKTMKRIPLRR